MCKFCVGFVPSRSFVKALKRKTLRVLTVDQAKKLNNKHLKDKNIIEQEHYNPSISNRSVIGGRGPSVVDRQSSPSSHVDSDFRKKETTQFEILLRGDNRFGFVCRK